MFRTILCLIGFHNWKITFFDGPKQERKCNCCPKEQHTTYDMAYGETTWTHGLHWSKWVKKGI